MISKLTSRNGAAVLGVLSIVYGSVVAVLGAFDSPAVGPVAAAGALLLGGLWAARSMLARKDTEAFRQTPPGR